MSIELTSPGSRSSSPCSPRPSRATGGTAAPTAFASQLQAASPVATTAALPRRRHGCGGQAMLNLVRNEVGVAEQPPGSNDGAAHRPVPPGHGRLRRRAVVRVLRLLGRPRGRACRSATPGQGFGRVDDVWAWAERSGKAIPAAGAQPQPGDLIVWDEHIGIVESVGADGTDQHDRGQLLRLRRPAHLRQPTAAARSGTSGSARSRLGPCPIPPPKACGSTRSSARSREKKRAEEAEEAAAEEAHAARADKADYLREKLAERAKAEDEAGIGD